MSLSVDPYFSPRLQSLLTPQSAPIPGQEEKMVPNNAGGFGFKVEDWQQFLRFLLLGTVGGTFYVSQEELTYRNVEVISRLLEAGQGYQMVDQIVATSESGEAVSNDPALFALACVSSYKVGERHDVDAIVLRRYALNILPEVARTGTHLFHFFHFLKAQRGMGNLARKALQQWYNLKGPRYLGYQLLKYKQRDKIASHRDLLQLAHPKAPDERHRILYHWIVRGWEGVGEKPHPDEALQQVWASERIKGVTNLTDAATLIRDYRLPWEVVPTYFLKEGEIWEALLADIPYQALLKNLARLTRNGVLTEKYLDLALAVLEDDMRIFYSHIHPIQILTAYITYMSGKGVRSNETWEPIRSIVYSLEKAFYAAFKNVEPTGKSRLLAIDVSASMTRGQVNGIANLPVHLACAAIALVTLNVEERCDVVGFDTSIYHFNIPKSARLSQFVETLGHFRGGATNCSLPTWWAKEQNKYYDSFELYTDSESFFDDSRVTGHAYQHLQNYRASLNPNAKLVTVQATATHASIIPQRERQTLEVIGFGPSVPHAISTFVKSDDLGKLEINHEQNMG